VLIYGYGVRSTGQFKHKTRLNYLKRGYSFARGHKTALASKNWQIN